MLSQELIGTLGEGLTQPTLAALFLQWWYLIILSLLVAFALSWMTIQFVKADKEMRRAARAVASGQDDEAALASVVHFRARRQSVIRPILLLLMVLYFAAYPVAKSWYGLE